MLHNNASTTNSATHASKSDHNLLPALRTISPQSSVSSDNNKENNYLDKNKAGFKMIVNSERITKKLNKVIPENIDNYLAFSTPTEKILELSYISYAVTKKITVMIVDDSAMNRKIVRRTIDGFMSANTLHGCQVVIVEADDGTTAVEMYKNIMENNESVDLFVLGKSLCIYHINSKLIILLRGCSKLIH